MAINEDLFEFDDEQISNPTVIKVIGVGGAGNNAVTRMMEAGVKGVEFIAVNTDAQDLNNAKADKKIRIGDGNNDGLGAGAQPQVGLNAAKASREELREAVEGADLLFITAGMGGGTGTGAAPVIADMSKEEMGILTIGVVSRPFECEGPVRQRNAAAGVKQLRNSVDTLIIVPNERLFEVVDENATFPEALKVADNVLFHGVHGISELIIEEGIFNLDFADVRTVMQERGDALMGIGEADGENAAVEAAKRALDCPLLETNNLEGATGIIINITGDPDVTLHDIRTAVELVKNHAAQDANIIFGKAQRDDMEDTVRVTVIATGFPGDNSSKKNRRNNVRDITKLSEDEINKRPAYQRKREGVEVINSDPDNGESPEEDDENTLNIPTFMRVR
jgi:cell division protein FtsZ